jgi:toluene monooxygenase system ferredoxin subunit
MSFRRVMPAAELWEDEVVGVVVNGQPVLLTNVGGAVYAYADRCAHKGVMLSRCRPVNNVLTCWAHAWQYDLLTGQALNPRGMSLVSFPAKIDEDQIWVDVDWVDVDIDGQR